MEIEVKFYISKDDLNCIRSNIKILGGVYVSNKFETNIIFEDMHNTLVPKNAVLRLRHGGKNTLTYKEPSGRGKTSQKFKVSREIEVEVNDFDKTMLILNKLGFKKFMKYERIRESFRFGKSTILIDQTPFGFFLEIEGGKKDILAIVKNLQLDWKKRIKESYIRIFADLIRKGNISFDDLTFENVENLDLRQLRFDKFIERYWQ